MRHWGIRPSLRDLCNRSCEPGSQLPGYSQISLRETKAANRSKLQSARRDEKKVFIRCGPIPLKTAGNLEFPIVRFWISHKGQERDGLGLIL